MDAIAIIYLLVSFTGSTLKIKIRDIYIHTTLVTLIMLKVDVQMLL